MNLNQWSFVLSTVGLVLGLVSAYPQLRSAVNRALKIGADGVNRLVYKHYAQADFFITYPSAFIAYIVKSTFILAFIFVFGFHFLRPNSPSHLPLLPWLQLVLSLGFTFALGNIGGDLLNTARLVVRRAKNQYDEDSRSG